jgi:fatty acid desaturase
LTWNNYAFFGATHWKHHKFTLSENDPKSLFKGQLTLKSIFFLLTIDFVSMYNRLKIIFFNSINFIPSGFHNDSIFKIGTTKRRNVVIAARTILLFHLVTVSFFIYIKAYWLIVLLNFASFIFTFPNKLLAISQHYGTDNKSENDYFNNTRTVKLNPFTSFLYANMNYHVEHHLFPDIPYYNLGNVHVLLSNKFKFNYLSQGFIGLIKDLNAKGLFAIK